MGRNSVKCVLLFAMFLAKACVALAGETGTAEEKTHGQMLYGDRCSECHGHKGAKKALGRSRRLNRLKRADIDAKLREYQMERRLRGMKDRMKSGLNDDDIRSLIEYILSLGRK